MDQSVEELFGALRDASASLEAKSATKKQDTFEQEDVLQIDKNDDEVDTESKFQEIEAGLKKLPKLENGFDVLAKKKTKKSQLPSVQTKEQGSSKKSNKDDSDWFSLPKPDDNMRREVQRDLLLIKHRSALDPKRHYKKQRWEVPERFAIGTIVEDKSEFYSSRMNKKERKSTILETLMGDETSNKYFKRKYSEIQEKSTSGRKAHYKKIKEMRKKRK
ncbi:hypothetical protein SKDZ_12G1040 [Saccharomyces kudriavzevii ZP591]|uniref:Uncharacterized protein n=3 Tax=Saccharomyces TaxID=4930 RepID=A0AA35J3E6_SACK1|nr:uncharacterized protein SKDI_12G1040 [Saccharomyces kudriavzevii IFO 1802]EHN01278.1 Fcf2p [Saccharomyces cerevisiae x Saccharomyces kudriavzevii VIN7]EJT44336.1 FCF2-like protein [Saccharomyces kudriavzevii IFO 1802]CAI4045849.1 hypothetical protein SKDI_12G1040 [Saccharomyces kudriavzevii IFO 1802]CAI4045884.1 hypothetical protein SKDZ_12G1040 [Saccharomyces kudriavzevii ZP591]